eukprot:IDg10684t1
MEPLRFQRAALNDSYDCWCYDLLADTIEKVLQLIYECTYIAVFSWALFQLCIFILTGSYLNGKAHELKLFALKLQICVY